VPAAVPADVAVTGEQPVLGQSDVRMSDRNAVPAADHHDRAGDEFGAKAGALLHAAGHREQVLAEIGQHFSGCPVASGARQLRPTDRLAVGVDDQDARPRLRGEHGASLPRHLPLCIRKTV
jgi:hypothetical protein